MVFRPSSRAAAATLVLAVGVHAPARAAEAPEEAGRRETREETLMLDADLVFGWGRVPFAVANPPGAGSPAPSFTRADDVASNVQSLLVGGSAEIAEHVEVGARVPFTFARFSPSPDGSSSRGAQSFGNVELEAEYARSPTPR